ncbi:hypothetical protein ANCCEY_03519 [Ancylostoma ceylanicum]|uniref:Uncharacterized protein n=1 Tax=Ancylostoma ceylanicum TaxID=53326 RepID=A0A0D6M4R5_9BILA|nr:hypothetical protein ANCCEY_03519 [Ancylostoma ceylanicum]
MAVGNGELSAIQQLNSIIHMAYFHGIYGKQNDVYNIYQDCYQQSSKVFGTRIKSHQRQGIVDYFVDQGQKVSISSTDNQGGFQCYASDAAAQYLNQDVNKPIKGVLHSIKQGEIIKIERKSEIMRRKGGRH